MTRVKDGFNTIAPDIPEERVEEIFDIAGEVMAIFARRGVSISDGIRVCIAVLSTIIVRCDDVYWGDVSALTRKLLKKAAMRKGN